MFVGAAIFIGSICALSRNARVGAEIRSGKCEFAHVMGNVVKVKSAFVLRAHVYRVPPVLSSTFSVFVVRVCLPVVAVSVPRLRTCASAAACASNHNGLRGLGVFHLRVWSSREFWCAFWLNEPGGANDIYFRGVGAVSESGFGVVGVIVSGSCIFCVFHREQYGQDRSKTSHIISKNSQIIHIFANNVP